MSRTGIRGLVALLALAGATGALALAEPAGAGQVKKVSVSGTITFTPPDAFSGKVNSKVDACESGARVSLWRYQNKNDTTAENLGTDKANRKGRWDIMVPNAQQGEFQIQILGRKVSPGDVVYKCKAFTGLRVRF
jgi:hypothetical protein